MTVLRCSNCNRLEDRCICDEDCVQCAHTIRHCTCECDTCEREFAVGCDCDRDDDFDDDSRLSAPIKYDSTNVAPVSAPDDVFVTLVTNSSPKKTKTKAVAKPKVATNFNLHEMTEEQAAALRRNLALMLVDDFFGSYNYNVRANGRYHDDAPLFKPAEFFSAVEQVMATCPLYESLFNPDYVEREEVLNTRMSTRTAIDSTQVHSVRAVMSVVAPHKFQYDVSQLLHTAEEFRNFPNDENLHTFINTPAKFFYAIYIALASYSRGRPMCSVSKLNGTVAPNLVGWFESDWDFRPRGLQLLDNAGSRNETSFGRASVNSISVSFLKTIIPRLVTVDSILDSEMSKRGPGSMLYRELNSERFDTTRTISAFCGYLVEGIHYNRHRRNEIAHLIWSRPGYGRMLLAEEVLAANDEDDELFGEGYYSLASSLPNIEVVIVNGAMITYDAMHAVSLLYDDYLYEHPIMELESNARIAKSRRELRSRIDHHTEAYRTMMDATANVREAALEVHLAMYAKDMIRARAEDIVQSIRKNFSWIERCEYSERFGLLLETTDLYGSPEYADHNATRDPRVLEKRDSYIGRFHIVIDPVSAAWNMRNIAAPLVIESRDRVLTDLKLLKAVHPHSQPHDEEFTVCIGSYAHRLTTLLRATGVADPIAPVADMLQTLHALLTTFNPEDAYASTMLDALETYKPPITAVSRWYFTGSSARVPQRMFGVRNIMTTFVTLTRTKEEVSKTIMPQQPKPISPSSSRFIRADTAIDNDSLRALHEEISKWTN